MTKTRWVVVGLVCLAAAAVGYAFLQGGPWETHMAAGAKAYQQGNYPEAEKQFTAAVKEAEHFGPEDPRLATTLNYLGLVYDAQGKYAEAEPLYKRALAIVEKAPAGVDEGFAAYNRGDYATALRELRPLAEQGDGTAQSVLGQMYEQGKGVPQDHAEAVRWWRKAAEQGHVTAQLNLGNMYRKGQGVPQDHAEAVKWYRKAAEQGHGWSQYNLGLMYGRGLGVPQDYVQAHMWFNLAALRFPPGARAEAAKKRNIVAKLMTPAQIAEAQRLAREWKPKSQH